MIDANTLSIVTAIHRDSAPTYHFVRHEDVDTMVEAIKKLHTGPAINPFSHNPTAHVVAIHVRKLSDLELTGPFWWTSPTLGEDGVQVADFIGRHGGLVWKATPYDN